MKYKEEGMLVGSITPGNTAKKDFILPDIVPSNQMTPLGSTNNANNQRLAPLNQPSNYITKMSLQSTGGAGFNSSAQKPVNPTEIGGVIRPPLYVPQKRDGARAATGMLSGAGI